MTTISQFCACIYLASHLHGSVNWDSPVEKTRLHSAILQIRPGRAFERLPARWRRVIIWLLHTNKNSQSWDSVPSNRDHDWQPMLTQVRQVDIMVASRHRPKGYSMSLLVQIRFLINVLASRWIALRQHPNWRPWPSSLQLTSQLSDFVRFQKGMVGRNQWKIPKSN